MTRDEFLNFNMSVFYNYGYETERKCLNAITRDYLFSIINAESYLNEDKSTRYLSNPKSSWYADPNNNHSDYTPALFHEKEQEFLKQYEKECKNFVYTYLKNYQTIKETIEKKPNPYVLANKCRNDIAQISKKFKEQRGVYNFSEEDIERTGLFIDYRLSACYSLDKSSLLIPNLKEESYVKAAESHIQSLNKLIENIKPSPEGQKNNNTFTR